MAPSLRKQREARGWSQADVASQLRTSVTLVHQWEEGVAVPSPFFRQELSRLFGVEEHILWPSAGRGDAQPRETFAFLFLPHASTQLPSRAQEAALNSEKGIYDPLLPLPFTRMTALIGRDRLLAQSKQHLLQHRVLSLYGLPGVGKTALATALAYDQEIRAQFCDGVLWAGLTSQLASTQNVLRRWGSLLGITAIDEESQNPPQAWYQAVQAILADRRLLLIVDDVWQAETVDALRVGGTQCGYLLTTRFAHIARLIDDARVLQVPELDDDDGLHLLTRFAPGVLQDQRDSALALVRAVGGLPLALSLMGKYLGGNAYTGQPRRLQAALKHLQDAEQRVRLRVSTASLPSSLTNSAERGVSIESVIAVSDLHLPVAARQALRALGVLPPKPVLLTREAALAVTDASLETLDMLCDAGLLEQRGPTHYMLHKVIADYVYTQGIEPAASRRLIQYGISFIERHLSDIPMLDQESAIIQCALESAWTTEQYEAFIRGCLLYMPFLLQSGWYSLADQLLRRVYSIVAQEALSPNKLLALKYLSLLTHQQGDYAEAQAYALKGLMQAYRQKDQGQIIDFITVLGVILQEVGRYSLAKVFYQEGLDLARQQNNQEQICALLKNLGVLAKKHGDYTTAQAYYQEGLTLARQSGYHALICLLLMNLGVIASERGDYQQAQTFYQEGLELARQLGHRLHICALLSNQGVIAVELGNYTQAESHFGEGLALARQLGHRERISLLLLNLGVVAEQQGDDKRAEAAYQEGLVLARQLGHRERISLLLLNLGDVAMQQNADARAQSYFQEALMLARQLRHRKYMCDLLLHLGLLAIKQGQPEQARFSLQEGQELADQLGDPQLSCNLLGAWGEFYLLKQDLEAAEHMFAEMLARVPAGNRTSIAQAQYGLAKVARRRGQSEKAQTLAEQSYSIFEQLGHRQKNLVQAFLADGTP